MPDSVAAAQAGVRPELWRGQEALRLTTAQGDTALVTLQGAQVLSWVAGGRERLYLSPEAVADGQTAIRGGIPLCFPQFNQRGPLPKHGFARNLPWEADAPEQDAKGRTLQRLRLADSPRSWAWWPETFVAELTLTLGDGELQVVLAVENPGATPWEFTTALHSYLRVEDVASAQVHGLDGCARWDAVTDQRLVQPGPVGFAGEYDSVFQAPPSRHLWLQDGIHRLDIHQSDSLPQAVVWNPGAALCSRLADLPPEGWRQMLCVEAAAIDAPVCLGPGERWTGWQHLRVA